MLIGKTAGRCRWEYMEILHTLIDFSTSISCSKSSLSYSAIPLLGIYPEQNTIQKDICPQCSLQYCLQEPRQGSNLNVHQ